MKIVKKYSFIIIVLVCCVAYFTVESRWFATIVPNSGVNKHKQLLSDVYHIQKSYFKIHGIYNVKIRDIEAELSLGRYSIIENNRNKTCVDCYAHEDSYKIGVYSKSENQLYTINQNKELYVYEVK